MDRLILSPVLFPLVNQFEVFPFDPLLIDAHCGIHFSVICKNNQSDNPSNIVTNETKSVSKPIWIGPEAEAFRKYLNTDDVAAFVERVDEVSLRNDVTKADICRLTTECSSCLLHVAESAGVLKQVHVTKTNKSQEWSNVPGLMINVAH